MTGSWFPEPLPDFGGSTVWHLLATDVDVIAICGEPAPPTSTWAPSVPPGGGYCPDCDPP